MNIIVKAIAGSHLFGTSTPASDTDFKGVYIPSKEDLLLGNAKSSISIKTNDTGSKNGADDIDTEYYSLQKFMHMLAEGQTVALELLWTPENMIQEKTPLWDFLVAHREELMHKKVTAFVGYCKTQANKYGVKGSRMATIKKISHYIKNAALTHPRVKLGECEAWDFLRRIVVTDDLKHVEFGAQETRMGSVSYIEICGRKFQSTVTIGYMADALTKIYDKYGERAKQAEQNEGIDWKALSHAYRVLVQATEILSTGKLTLPIPNPELHVIREIKAGNQQFKDVQLWLEKGLETIEGLVETSKLKDCLDEEKWCKNFVVENYEALIQHDIVQEKEYLYSIIRDFSLENEGLKSGRI